MATVTNRSARARAEPRPESTYAGGGDARTGSAPRGHDVRLGTWPTLRRTIAEFREDNLTDWAAALTYYGLLAIFPALIAVVGVIGVFADPRGATETITDVVTEIGPESAADTFSGPIRSITENSGASGVMAIVGLAIAVWSASGYIAAFTRASNVVYETPEGRPAWKLRPLQVLIALAMVVFAAIVLVALAVSGPLAEAIGSALGVSDAAVTIYQIAKWPILLAVVLTMIAVLYYATPNVRLRGFKWVTPGSLVAMLAWIVASAGFAFYVANFGSYDKTYGTLGGLVILLIWMWITNLALLFGHELNAERERSIELAEGRPRADRELQLEPRAAPKERVTA